MGCNTYTKKFLMNRLLKSIDSDCTLSQIFFKVEVYNNFAKTPVLESLFNQVASLY